jgi:type I restriction enzyme S subunit
MTAQQLKNSILQMAVQGKLVPQDPNDEPASVLLERIRAEKEQLIKEKKIKKEKNPSVIFRGADNLPYEKVGKNEPVCIADEVPFEIPDLWEWTRLGHVITLLSGTDFKPSEYNDKQCGIPYITGASSLSDFGVIVNRWTETPRVIANKGDVLLVCKGSGYGKTVICDIEEAHIARQIMAIKNLHTLDMNYVRFFLQSCFAQIKAKGQGVIPGIDRSSVLNLLFPLPPLHEQKRIVAKLLEVISMVDVYGTKEETLYEYNAKFPVQLKKSILQWAVQGRLVPQDPNDEPASILLERIRAEKQRLVKEGKIKKDKHESVIFRRDNSHYEKLDGEERCINDELPFEIPTTWIWVHLDDVCNYIQRGKSPKYSSIQKYPVIAQKCNQWDGFFIDKAKFITPESLTSYATERFLQDNDLMWNSTGLGTLGRIAIYKEALNPYELAVADSHVTVIRPLKRYILPEYLYFYFSNPSVQSVIEEKADGTTKQKELATSTIKKYYVPIPPLEEQKRIIAKINEILPLIQQC